MIKAHRISTKYRICYANQHLITTDTQKREVETSPFKTQFMQICQTPAELEWRLCLRNYEFWRGRRSQWNYSEGCLRFLISNFRRVLNVVCFLLGDCPASEFYMPTFRNTLFHLHRQVGACLPMKMEQGVSKRRHIKFRRPGINHKKEYNMCKVLKRPTNARECMNIYFLNSNHRHVSATRVAVFRVVRQRKHIQLQRVAINTQLKNKTFS